MKILPTRLRALTRSSIFQVDDNFVIDGEEYTSNFAPTGRQINFPVYSEQAGNDFEDVKKYQGYLAVGQEPARMFMRDGSFSINDKIGQGLFTAPLDRIQGYLLQFDSRLPLHFNSVSGVTAGKKFIATNKGIVEVKPKFKRGLPMGRDVFWLRAYNQVSATTSNSSHQQQIILGETETEFFGFAWGYYGFPIPVLASTDVSQSAMWRSTKKVADIDNATKVVLGTNGQDAFDLAYIGTFGDYAIGLRMHSDSVTNDQRYAMGMRPMSLNIKTGVAASIDTAQRSSFPTHTQSSSGYRFAPHNRAVLETETTISLFIALPQAGTETVNDGTMSSMTVRRYDLNKATGVWANPVTVLSGDPTKYGDVITKGNLGTTGSLGATTVVNSWFIDVQGTKHLVVILMGTNSILASNASYTENTHQYVYRLNADNTLTFVSKLVQPQLFGTPDCQAGYAMSKDRRVMYLNTYSGHVKRMVFDESIMAYRYDLQYEVDVWSMHVADDETLTLVSTNQDMYRMLPTMGSVIRLTFGAVAAYDGQPLFTNVSVAALNHLGERIVTSVKLELDGPLSFTVNALQTLTVNTSATEDLAIPVQITGVGDIYCTPVKP